MRVVARRQRALVFLDLDEVWACEASERLTYVHSSRGRFDLDLTLSRDPALWFNHVATILLGALNRHDPHVFDALRSG